MRALLLALVLAMVPVVAQADKVSVIVTDGDVMKLGEANVTVKHDGTLLFCLYDARNPNTMVCLFGMDDGTLVPVTVHRATGVDT